MGASVSDSKAKSSSSAAYISLSEDLAKEVRALLREENASIHAHLDTIEARQNCKCENHSIPLDPKRKTTVPFVEEVSHSSDLTTKNSNLHRKKVYWVVNDPKIRSLLDQEAESLQKRAEVSKQLDIEVKEYTNAIKLDNAAVIILFVLAPAKSSQKQITTPFNCSKVIYLTETDPTIKMGKTTEVPLDWFRISLSSKDHKASKDSFFDCEGFRKYLDRLHDLKEREYAESKSLWIYSEPKFKDPLQELSESVPGDIRVEFAEHSNLAEKYQPSKYTSILYFGFLASGRSIMGLNSYLKEISQSIQSQKMKLIIIADYAGYTVGKDDISNPSFEFDQKQFAIYEDCGRSGKLTFSPAFNQASEDKKKEIKKNFADLNEYVKSCCKNAPV